MSYQLDHIHVPVTNRPLSVDWFNRVLGLTVDPKYERGADDPMGPLTLKSSDGHACLALFQRPPADCARDHTIALRTNGEAFLGLAARLDDLNLVDNDGVTLTSQSVVDHAYSWSIYFVDLDQNRFEVTTYDYDLVAGRM